MKKRKTKTCTNCNKSLAEDDVFCNSCGQKYLEPTITNNEECSNCKNPIQEDQIFCSFCGIKNESKPQVVFCPKCGAEKKENAKFCSGCGNNFSQQANISGNQDPNINIVSKSINVNNDNVNNEKIEAIEFCMKKYLKNRMIEIWLVIILTLGIGILIAPIFIFRYRKGKKRVKRIKAKMYNDQNFLNKVRAARGFNSISIDFDGESIEVPQGMIWFSKYSKKSLSQILNVQN